jgi:pimeloyl-ACP methyl ester carboxylesterase
MGDVSDPATISPRAIEQRLPWGPVLRGVRWGDGSDLALLLHDPGRDLDAWAPLAGEIAGQLGIETIAVDLPGHGLSDDPWEPERLLDLLPNLQEVAPEARRRFLIAAGDSAVAALEQANTLELSGLVCLSPPSPAHIRRPPRSPRVPKLFLAGSLAGGDLDVARRLASACGGWVVVTSYPVSGRGTELLASAWSRRLVEEVLAFLRDCQQGQVRASLPPLRVRREQPNGG